MVLLLCTFGYGFPNHSVTIFVDTVSNDLGIMGFIRALYYTYIYHVNYKPVHKYSKGNGSAE